MAKFLPIGLSQNQKENPTPLIGRDKFMEGFEKKNSPPKDVTNTESLKSASNVIDKHSEIQSDIELENLADELLESNSTMHSSNEMLKFKEDNSTLTKRIDPRGLLSKEDKLPKTDISTEITDDDLDL